MLTIEQYIDKSGLDRSTVFRHLSKGKIASVKIKGSRYILEDGDSHDNYIPEVTTSKAASLIISEKKKEWNNLIIIAHNTKSKDTRIKITKQVAADAAKLKEQGYKVVGFDLRSVQRKVASGQAERPTRDDCGLFRNSILKSIATQDKILELSAYVYFEICKSDINLVQAHVTKFAEEHEDFYEIAAIPARTLRRFIDWKFACLSFKQKHQLLHHYNQYVKHRIRVKGAFTDNCEFMDWIIGDDHKMDIDKVLVWNPYRKVFEKKKVEGWFWMDGKSGKVLGYVIKHESLKAEDLILSLMDVLKKYGKSTRGILMDNGLGRSAKFQSFVSKAGLSLRFCKPHDPTGKAPVERMFEMFKYEFDVRFKNFTGSNHQVEGRHPTLELSPPAPDITFEEYANMFEQYVYGFYETRNRNRVISGKAFNISNRDLFNYYWKGWEFKPIEDTILRFAYQKCKIKTWNDSLTIKIDKVENVFVSIPPLSRVLKGRKLAVYYDNKDYSDADLYATEYLEDHDTGEIFYPNAFIKTIININRLPNPKNVEIVTRLNKKIQSTTRDLGKLHTDVYLVNHEDRRDLLHASVDSTGAIASTREELERKYTHDIKNAVPVSSIPTFNVKPEDVKDGGIETEKPAELTDADFDELNQPL